MLASKKSENLAVHLSAKKLAALKELSRLGIKLSDGYDYELWEYASSGTSLAKVRKRLSSIKTSVSEDVVKERNR